jgi:hypothetical protein
MGASGRGAVTVNTYRPRGPRAEGFEYTGTLAISRPASSRIAMRRVGSTAGLSSETPTAITFALSIASMSLSQSNPMDQ